MMKLKALLVAALQPELDPARTLLQLAIMRWT